MRGPSGNIERAVISGLVCGERERFRLLAGRMGAIKVAVQASLQIHTAVDEIRRLLQMIVAFEQHLSSPSVADALREILRADPDALALVRRELTVDDLPPALVASLTAPVAQTPASPILVPPVASEDVQGSIRIGA